MGSRAELAAELATSAKRCLCHSTWLEQAFQIGETIGISGADEASVQTLLKHAGLIAGQRTALKGLLRFLRWTTSKQVGVLMAVTQPSCRRPCSHGRPD